MGWLRRGKTGTVRAIYTSHVTGTKSLWNIPDPGTVLSGHVTRKFTGTRKAGDKAFEVSRGEETPPGTAGDNARAWTSAAVLPGATYPPIPAANRSLLSAFRMAISRPPGTSDLVSEPIINAPTNTTCQKLGAPLRPGHEETRSQTSFLSCSSRARRNPIFPAGDSVQVALTRHLY